MALYTKYIRDNFNSYEDFKVNGIIEAPDNFNFAYDVVDEIARVTPDKRALQWCDVDGHEKTVTFGEMKKYSDKAANYFRSVGVERGTPVMLILKRHYQFWYAIIALHKLGAIAIPGTHLLTVKDIVYRVEAADITHILCTTQSGAPEKVREAAEQSCRKVKLIAAGEAEGFDNFDAEIEAASDVFERPGGKQATVNEDIMLCYFTSGTTGYPKMVRHDYLYPLAHIITARFWQNVVDGGLHLTISETGWAKSVWGKLYGQWLCGTAVMVYEFDKFVPADVLSVIEKYKVTTLCAPPTMYRYFIKEDLSKFDFSSIQHAVVAGEPLNPEVYNAFLEKTGLHLYEGFGQTETTATLANYYPWMKVKPGSMGKPAPGYDVDIVDERGRRCRAGEVGEVVIKTTRSGQIGMFTGYYKDEELTNNAWRSGYYHSGDMAWRDEQGYFWFVGRADDVIKSSGYRIGPFEVESALMEHPGVLECAITGVPDEVRGQVVKATIVLVKGYEGSEELKKELQEHVKRVTAPYKYPRIVEFVEELPKTISGKIRRVELRK